MTLISMRTVLWVGLAWAVSARAEAPLNETRSTLEKWVETRQLISKTRSDWQSDKDLLEQSIQLFEREVKSVEEQIGKLDTNNTQVEKERAQAEAELKHSNESLERSRRFAADLESQIGKQIPQLPVPLQDILKPLLGRMPTNSLNTRMAAAERTQVIIGILNELDKFNNSVAIFGEKRKNPKGEEVAVETVYVGLGAAYFVNEAGDFAGAGVPGSSGWEWDIQPELASSVREVIRIYRNERPARFVSLPASIR